MAQNRQRLDGFFRNKSIAIFFKPRNTLTTPTSSFCFEWFLMQKKIRESEEKPKGSHWLTFDYVLFEKASLSWVNALTNFTSSSHHSCGKRKSKHIKNGLSESNCWSLVYAPFSSLGVFVLLFKFSFKSLEFCLRKLPISHQIGFYPILHRSEANESFKAYRPAQTGSRNQSLLKKL